jgi:hypothetical protein
MLDVLFTSKIVRMVSYILQQLLSLLLTCTTADATAVACIVGKNQLLLM